MKKYCKILLAGLLALLVGVVAEAATVYVSSSFGSDENTGLTQDSPLRSINLAIEKGTRILLKAGDVFYGSVSCYGRELSRYGEGPNPMISGYKRIDGQRWKRVSDNIWKIKLVTRRFSGNTVEGSSFLNNVGCIHEYDKGVIHGRKVQHREDLKNDWDFWQTGKNGKEVTEEDYDYLYLYLSKNPRRIKLEFSTGIAAMSLANATVEGVDFEGFGFGLAAGTHTTIRNCNIDAMGGMQAVGAESFICYGNGIEFYVASNIEDCLVEKCRVSRCYDCGITIQASDQGQATPRNILIRDNVIVSCCQGWEDFLRNDDNVVFVKCRFSHNIVLDSGNSGFGYSDGRFKYCHVLGNNFKGDKGMIIEGNVFVGGNYYCTMPYKGRYTSHKWRNNVCYITPGCFILSNYVGTADVIRITESGKDKEVAEYRRLTGDKTTRFVLCTQEVIDEMIDKYVVH